MDEPKFPHQFQQEQKLLPLPVKEFKGEPPSYPPVVIEGLLRQTEILLMGGQAKKYKSWARADMLYCVGNGFKWLNFPTHQGMVIHLDLELLEADLRWRFDQIHQSYCQEGLKGTLENLRYVPLRGAPFIMSDLEAHAQQFSDPHYILASVDPIYRLLGGKSESDPAAVSDLLTRFLNLGSKTNSSIALLQHFTKGDQSQKESQDRFSGTSIWSRFPDSLLTFTDLQDRDCFSCEFTLRSFEPIEPFAVRWQFPRFRIDDALDPDNLKEPRGRPRKTSLDQFCAVLTTGETLPHSEFMRRAQKLLGISPRSFNRRLKEATAAKAIYFSKLDPEGYALHPDFIHLNGQ